MFSLFANYAHWLHYQWPAGQVEKYPQISEKGKTGVRGVRITGDLTGIPLLKFAVDSGVNAVRDILQELDARGRREAESDILDLAIIGGGVSGISAAIEAKRLGLSFKVFDTKGPFSTIADFPAGKPILAYPTEMIPAGDFQVSADKKESLLEEMEAQRQTHGIEVTAERVDHVERKGDRIILYHGQKGSETQARRVITAIGRSGNFRKLNCPGETLPKVFNRLHDPKDFTGKKVLVVGGGDFAVEAALALAKNGSQVDLSYRGQQLSRPKPENVEQLNLMAQASDDSSTGSVHLALGTTVKEIRENEVVLTDSDKQEHTLVNDVVFTLIGREAPLGFFRRSGIRIRGEGTTVGWIALGIFLLFCVFLYTWKGEGFTEKWLDPWPGNSPHLVSSLGPWFQAKVADRATLVGTLAVSLKSKSFYYTLLYSLCVVIFGLLRIRRRKTPYISAQTSVLMAIQVFPLFLLPEILLPWLGYNGIFTEGLGRLIADNLFELYIPFTDHAQGLWPEWGHPRAYWRAYGLVLAWPLMVYNVFTNAPMGWWLVISLVQTFIIIPWLVFYFGKGAYCGWICSCGALAETLGDTLRDKMPHGPFWNRLNMIGQIILGLAMILLMIRISGWIWPDSWMAGHFGLLLEGKDSEGSLINPVSYKWLIDVSLAGILGVGLYFKYSGRVWCRFACPLSALMHIYARFSRFRIFSDKKKCISCNACTGVCHQGIDIMNFANKGLPMEDPECVRCSACVHICPTGTLTFGRYTRQGDMHCDSLAASPVQMKEGT